LANRHNQAAKIELKKQTKVAAGLLSERFPGIADIVINMTYYQKGANVVLMVRTVNVFPTSYAYFNMDCMIKGCDGGGFDLSPVVSDMVKSRKKVKKGNLVCCGKVDTVDADHASIMYEIVIQYA